MKSISYYLVAIAIRLKQIKKIFSVDPIDYLRLRKDDTRISTRRLTLGLSSSPIQINNSLVTEIFPKRIASKKVILYFHGGALVYGPTQLHWNTLSYIVKKTDTKAFLVDYPKAPQHQIGEVNKEIDAIYNYLLTIHSSSRIVILGDSAGATLAILLIQRLIKKELPLPSAAILISPVLDCSMSNPSILEMERNDLMLSRKGVLSAKKMSAGMVRLQSDEISPLYGSFKGFVPTHLFIATHDIMYPDAKLFAEELKNENKETEVIIGEGMPHIWPLLPLMSEAKMALDRIAKIINGK
jgi:acetyl esterase/lipase